MARLLLAAFVIAVAWLYLSQPAPKPSGPICPGPDCPDNPSPCPGPGPCPAPKPNRPWGPQEAPVGARASVGGRSFNGDELTVDLPGSLHIKNIGSKRDGAGMCVTSSIEMQARALGMEDFYGFRDWCANEPGGAYPSKVDDQIKRYCQAKGIPVPRYIQVEGGPQEIQSTLSQLDRSGRCAAITYGTGERYGNRQIAHMTFCPRFGKYGVNLDNNFPGEDAYEWMEPVELVRRVCYPSGSGWVFSFLVPSGVNQPIR